MCHPPQRTVLELDSLNIESGSGLLKAICESNTSFFEKKHDFRVHARARGIGGKYDFELKSELKR